MKSKKHLKKMILGVIILAAISCESEKKRSFRIEADSNVYETLNPSSFHLDKKCTKLSTAENYRMYAKKNLEIIHGDICTEFRGGKCTVLTFCPHCSKPEDIDRLKQQIKIN